MDNPHPLASPARKHRYHHGDLQSAAVKLGRAIVALHGPDALTLRGVARELGVTAPALVYHFGSRAGLRSAVAASILEDAKRAAFARTPETPAAAARIGAAWIAYAAANPLAYRLATGEGWRAQPGTTNGIDTGGLAVRSPRRLLYEELARRARTVGGTEGDVIHADRLAFTIHGLALARLDGASADAIEGALSQLRTRPALPPSAGDGGPT